MLEDAHSHTSTRSHSHLLRCRLSFRTILGRRRKFPSNTGIAHSKASATTPAAAQWTRPFCCVFWTSRSLSMPPSTKACFISLPSLRAWSSAGRGGARIVRRRPPTPAMFITACHVESPFAFLKHATISIEGSGVSPGGRIFTAPLEACDAGDLARSSSRTRSGKGSCRCRSSSRLRSCGTSRRRSSSSR